MILIYILMMSFVVVAVTVALDVMTNPEYDRERRAKNQYFANNHNHYVGRHRHG